MAQAFAESCLPSEEICMSKRTAEAVIYFAEGQNKVHALLIQVVSLKEECCTFLGST